MSEDSLETLRQDTHPMACVEWQKNADNTIALLKKEIADLKARVFALDEGEKAA